MKHVKPGQFCTINGVVYRAKRRTHNCKGCALDSITMCPNIVDCRHEERPFACSLDDIIFIRV